MGRRRELEGETRDVHSSIPLDDYNTVVESLGRDSISEYIRNKFNSDAQELKKRKEAKKIISYPYGKTAIGSILSNNENEVKATPELDESRLMDDFNRIERIIKPLEDSGNFNVLDFILKRSKHIFELVSKIGNPKVRFGQEQAPKSDYKKSREYNLLFKDSDRKIAEIKAERAAKEREVKEREAKKKATEEGVSDEFEIVKSEYEDDEEVVK